MAVCCVDLYFVNTNTSILLSAKPESITPKKYTCEPKNATYYLLEEQRRLISLVFTSMTLTQGVLAYEYSNAFKLIHNAVVETNGSKVANLAKDGAKIFEPNELPDKSVQKGSLRPSRPTWLRD
mgnify:CR=1 FL=1